MSAMKIIKFYWCNKKWATGTKLMGNNMMALDWMVTNNWMMTSHGVASGKAVHTETPTNACICAHTHAHRTQMVRVSLEGSRPRKK